MSLKVIKKPTLAETQKSLVDAVRQKDTAGHYQDNADRLAVYIRLVRNNTFGFIDRCFTEAQKHCSLEQWNEVKELFVREGKAHSPYFQDIAGEFFNFCQQRKLLNENILSLMDFEYAQLLSEVSEEKPAENIDIHNDTIMKLSSATYLKQYPINFISSDFGKFIEEPQYIVIWRNSAFEVYYQAIEELDYWLLSYVQEQPCSFNTIQESLKDIITSNESQVFTLFEKKWYEWVNKGAIIPR